MPKPTQLHILLSVSVRIRSEKNRNHSRYFKQEGFNAGNWLFIKSLGRMAKGRLEKATARFQGCC